MVRIEFSNIASFVEKKVCDVFNNLLEDEDIAIWAKYDEAEEIIYHLMMLGYNICHIDIESPDYGDYNDEFIISINEDGIWCEKAKSPDGVYLYDEPTIAYIMDDCNSAILKGIDCDEIYEVGIVDDCECCGCCECHCDCTKDNSSDDNFVVKVVKDGKVLTYSEANYALREALLDYCDMMDRYNDTLAKFKKLERLFLY